MSAMAVEPSVPPEPAARKEEVCGAAALSLTSLVARRAQQLRRPVRARGRSPWPWRRQLAWPRAVTARLGVPWARLAADTAAEGWVCKLYFGEPTLELRTPA